MKNFTQSIRYIAIIAALYFLTSYNTFAQASGFDGSFGLQFNGVLGMTDFKEYENFKPGFLGRAFLRYELSNKMELELGGGYGKIKGTDFTENYYETQIVPVDFRLLVRPFNSNPVGTYLYAGLGVLSYQVKDFPVDQTPNDDKGNGWTGIIPVGLGIDFEIAEDVLIDLNANFTYSFTDDINYFSRGANDAYASLGMGIIFVGNSGNSDKDKDGLTKSQEEMYGTDAEKADTDGDGVSDGDEINTYKTNPTKADTDADGLSDSDEIKNILTDPRKADSDGDGLNDGSEKNDYKTDPLTADTDNDGINDSDEVSKYKTNPLKSDTDGDNLKDGEEVRTYETNPLKSDTDGDGLDDGEEVNKYKTNPLNIDSDGGSVSDNVEIRRGTNPLDSDDDVVKVDVPMVLEGVTFASGKSDITPESAVILSSALKTLQTYNDIVVEIRGYTDNVGRKSSNIKLSQKRADSVRSWLIENGIDAARINAVGFGPDNAIVPNDSPDNRRKNRRIEFVRVK